MGLLIKYTVFMLSFYKKNRIRDGLKKKRENGIKDNLTKKLAVEQCSPISLNPSQQLQTIFFKFGQKQLDKTSKAR